MDGEEDAMDEEEDDEDDEDDDEDGDEDDDEKDDNEKDEDEEEKMENCANARSTCSCSAVNVNRPVGKLFRCSVDLPHNFTNAFDASITNPAHIARNNLAANSTPAAATSLPSLKNNLSPHTMYTPSRSTASTNSAAPFGSSPGPPQ